MRTISLLLLPLLLILSCKTQQVSNSSAVYNVDNYSAGELDIKVSPFGLDQNKITVGKITEEGLIQFDWPEFDLNTVKNRDLYLSAIDRALGMTFCNEKPIKEITGEGQAVEIPSLSLFKGEQYIGSLYPATDVRMQDNASLNRHSSLILGSSLLWFYSDGDVVFKAKCIVNFESENAYNFKEVTTYDIQFKKGWNLVEQSLLEKEDWKTESAQGSLPKVIAKTTINDIPEKVNWYINYLGQ